jgi:serine kinase of HPr protein (carbohydrate metabolism regulator)
MILHAGLLALRLGGFWRGVLILGASGAGKSDLALRAIDAGFRLVADDRVTVWASGGALFGRAPDSICGLIEARGHGVVAEPAIGFAEIVLAAECVRRGEIERLPEPNRLETAGTELPLIRIDPFEASAPAKLRRGLLHLGAAPQQGYQAASCGGGDRLGDRGNPLRPRR